MLLLFLPHRWLIFLLHQHDKCGDTDGGWNEADGIARVTTGSNQATSSPESRGKIFLQLVMKRPDWIHRRVETVTFLPDDATKRRVSYDFTAPLSLASTVAGGRVGIPITQMKKKTISNLSVTDASNVSLSVWDTDATGELGCEIVESALFGFLGRDLADIEIAHVRKIVFARTYQTVRGDIAALGRILRQVPNKNPDYLVTVLALIDEFAHDFIFVVEVPVDYLETRRLLKISYDKELDGDGNESEKFFLNGKFKFEGQYFPNAKSYHIEINAPEGLEVFDLTHFVSDHGITEWKPGESSETRGHIAHVRVQESGITKSKFALELRPARSGLIFQTFVGLTIGWGLLAIQLLGIGKLYQLIPHPAEIGPLAGISLALPAFLLTQVSRSREHTHVRKILRKPRWIASLSALVLFASSATLVLELSNKHFLGTLQLLLEFQSILWIWMAFYMENLDRRL